MFKVIVDMLAKVGIVGEVDNNVYYAEADFDNDEVVEAINTVSEVAVDIIEEDDTTTIKFKKFKVVITNSNE